MVTGFEFQLRPAEGAKAAPIQRLFTSHAFGEMLSPTVAVYRTQTGLEVDRKAPKLVILTSSTPIREGLFTFTWRIAVRKLGRGPQWHLPNLLLGRLMWEIVRWNYSSDMEVLRWTRTLERPLSVKAEGPSVREYRAYYRRNIVPGWRFGDRAQSPGAIGQPAVGQLLETAGSG
jgi:hypothetical protein